MFTDILTFSSAVGKFGLENHISSDYLEYTYPKYDNILYDKRAQYYISGFQFLQIGVVSFLFQFSCMPVCLTWCVTSISLEKIFLEKMTPMFSATIIPNC